MRTDPALRALVASALLGAAAALAAGCPGTLDDKSRFVTEDAGACGDVPTTIFEPTCARASCHSAVNPAQGLDLASPDVAARVVGQPATECVGTLADPLAPEASILYLKLTPSPPCGARMPFNGTPLSDAQIACVKDWIAMQVLPGTGGSGGTAGHGGAGGSTASSGGSSAGGSTASSGGTSSSAGGTQATGGASASTGG